MSRTINILTTISISIILLSCTTIRIEERDAFDAKRSVTADLLRKKDIPVQEITFSAEDDILLKGWFLEHPDAKGTVLYFGGNGYLLAISHDMLMANYRHKMNVFSFDYRGYGQSGGEPSIAGLKTDALAAYEFVTEELGVSSARLILHGHSLGSFLALFVSTQKDVRAVVLESPVSDVSDWTDQMVPLLLKPFVRFEIDENLKRENNLERVRQLDKPLLIVTGGNDKITPVKMSRNIFESAKSGQKKLVIIENGGHNDLPRKTAYLNALASFYESAFSD